MPAFKYDTQPKSFKSRTKTKRECLWCRESIESETTAYRLEHSWMYIFDTRNCADEYIDFMRLKNKRLVAKARKAHLCYHCNNVIRRGEWYYHPYGDSTWGTRTRKYCQPDCFKESKDSNVYEA